MERWGAGAHNYVMDYIMAGSSGKRYSEGREDDAGGAQTDQRWSVIQQHKQTAVTRETSDPQSNQPDMAATLTYSMDQVPKFSTPVFISGNNANQTPVPLRRTQSTPSRIQMQPNPAETSSPRGEAVGTVIF
ncbi:hypothetical protein DFH09DRAFT_1101358 [Mycena vulgaris]|nr:hypothetical protein DFH09DRAFT_1101358 [Mycena vulgaris]